MKCHALSLVLPLAQRIAVGLVATVLVLGSANAQTHVQGGQHQSVRSQAPQAPTSPQAPHGAPELSPGLAGAGILLFIGGTLVLLARRRTARA